MTAGSSSLDDARRALYGGSRATFVARRKVLAAAARSGGDRDGAKAIAEMRKPTAAAHVVNLLAQADDRSLCELVELGASIRKSMAQGNDRQTRALLQGRSAALAETLAHAKKIAHASGESVSGSISDQIVQTLRAAMASDDAAAAACGGALSDPLDEPGFEGVSIEPAARSASPKRSGRKKLRTNAEVAVDRTAEEDAVRVAARARITSAAADVSRAEQALASVIERRDELERDRDRLAAQLAQIEDEVTAARADLDDSTARLHDAEGT